MSHTLLTKQKFRKNMADESFFTAVAMGLVSGVAIRNINCRTTGVGAIGKPSDIAPWIHADNQRYVLPNNNAEIMKIGSTELADKGKITRIYGLDADGFAVQFDQALDAVDARLYKPLDQQLSRINDDVCISDEPGFAGTVSITDNSGAAQAAGTTIYSQILPRVQEQSQGIYSVPLNCRCYFLQLIGSIIKGVGADVEARLNVSIKIRGVVRREPFSFGLENTGNTIIALDNKLPDELPPSSDVFISGEASDAGVGVLARMAILEVDEELLGSI